MTFPSRLLTVVSLILLPNGSLHAGAFPPRPRVVPSSIGDRLVQALNTGYLSPAQGTFDAKHAWKDLGTEAVKPHAAFVSAWKDMRHSFAQLRLDPVRTLAGSSVVVLQGTLSGKHVLPYLGVAASGRESVKNALVVAWLRDDRIVRTTTYLGADEVSTPPAAAPLAAGGGKTEIVESSKPVGLSIPAIKQLVGAGSAAMTLRLADLEDSNPPRFASGQRITLQQIKSFEEDARRGGQVLRGVRIRVGRIIPIGNYAICFLNLKGSLRRGIPSTRAVTAEAIVIGKLTNGSVAEVQVYFDSSALKRKLN